MTIYSSADHCRSKNDDKPCDEYRGLYTVQCPQNYKKILKFICAPICPDGFTDNGTFCSKPKFKTYIKNVSVNFYDLFM